VIKDETMTTSTAPARAAPLTPEGCDLRNFLRMPLQVGRLLDSNTWIEAADDPRVGHALMSLWAASWGQVPCGSLPDSDAVLTRLSLCPSGEEWQRIKARALAGWVRCSDGRLYHPVVSEMALECWLSKLAARLKGGRGNAVQHGTALDEQGLLAQIEQAHALLTALNPMSEALGKAAVLLRGRPARKPRGSAPDGAGQSGRQGQGADTGAAGVNAAAHAGVAAGAHAGVYAAANPLRTQQRTLLRTQVRAQQRTQGKGRDLSPLPPLQQTPVDNFGGPDNPDPRRRPGWWDSRSGVEAVGVWLQCGRWDESASQLGRGEHWPAYQGRVLRAAGDGPWHALLGGGTQHVSALLSAGGAH
jgi:hypothetical protein